MAFKDTFGVEYSDDRQTLLKCPTSLTGSYTVSPMVKTIGKEAFKGCVSLSEIVLSDEIESIEQSAFEGCIGLSSIHIPRSVRSIGRKAFTHCDNIEEVCIESSDIEIDGFAFMFCNKINSVSITEGADLKDVSGLNKAEIVKVIKSVRITREMLLGFSKMKELYIPSSISVIEEGALMDCKKLCEVNVAPYNQNYLDIEGVLYNYDKSDLLFLPRNWQGVFTVPNTVKRILTGAIKDCQTLTSVVISENVEMIRQSFLFSDCPLLASIIVENNSNYSSKEEILYDARGNLLRCPEGKAGKLSIPPFVKGIVNGAFSSCNTLSVVEIPNSVEKIGVYAFGSYTGKVEVDFGNPNYVSHNGFLIDKKNSLLVYANKSITGHVAIDDNIVTIGHEAFCNCSELQSITFPITLKEIQSGAFVDCKNLTRIDFNDGIEKIGEYAFLGCEKLQKVVIPNSVKEIEHAFDDSIVSEITIPVGIKSVFYFNTFEDEKQCKYKSIKLNSGFETIEKEMFKGCSAVTDITIPASVTTIKANAFDDCKALKNIHYEGTLEEWLDMKWLCFVKNGYNLYVDGELLTEVVLDGSISEIRENAFYYCSSLKHLEIKDGVRIIGNSAFNKTGISGELVLPDSIEMIGEYAFLSCKNLESVSIPQKAKIRNGVFRYCDKLGSITVRGADSSAKFYTVDGVLYENNVLILLMEGEDGKNYDEYDNERTLVHYPIGRKASKFVVPTGLESIGDYAFTGVQNLTLVFTEFVPISTNTFLNAKVWIQVPIGMKQKFVTGKYPKDAIEEVWVPEVVAESDLPKKCLNVVANNPFRVLGISTNATAKEVSANKTKIMRFADVGKAIDFPLDLNGLIGQCVRDKATIEKASASLSLPQDKIKHALFWFAKESPIDEMALEHVQVGNIEKAIELLGKRESWSALMNQGVLWFAMGKVVNAVGSIMKVIHNNTYRSALFLATCGEAFSMDETELSRLFVNMLKSEISEKALLSILFEGGFIEEVDCLKEDVVGSIQAKINGEIDKTSNTNPDDAEASYQSGEALMNSTKQELEELKRILGASDMQYQSLANNVAKRILQFSINYHNAAGGAVKYEKALALAKYAESIAEGKLVKERCAENLKVMGENNIHAKIKDDEKLIIAKLNACKGVEPSLKMAQKLVEDCVPSLNNIKKVMGQKGKFYLSLSSSVANCALGMVITVVNISQKNDSDRRKLKVYEEAQKVMGAIGKLDMTYEEKLHYTQNNNTLNSISVYAGFNKKSAWDKILSWGITPYVFTILLFGVIGGVIDLFSDGEFLPGFGVGCGLAAAFLLINFLRQGGR